MNLAQRLCLAAVVCACSAIVGPTIAAESGVEESREDQKTEDKNAAKKRMLKGVEDEIITIRRQINSLQSRALSVLNRSSQLKQGFASIQSELKELSKELRYVRNDLRAVRSEVVQGMLADTDLLWKETELAAHVELMKQRRVELLAAIERQQDYTLLLERRESLRNKLAMEQDHGRFDSAATCVTRINELDEQINELEKKVLMGDSYYASLAKGSERLRTYVCQERGRINREIDENEVIVSLNDQVSDLEYAIGRLADASRGIQHDRRRALADARQLREQIEQRERQLTKLTVQKSQLDTAIEHEGIKIRINRGGSGGGRPPITGRGSNTQVCPISGN